MFCRTILSIVAVCCFTDDILVLSNGRKECNETIDDETKGQSFTCGKVPPYTPIRNLALRRPTGQSSFHKKHVYKSKAAVDGLRQAHWVPPYCMHTDLEHYPYWFVDLQVMRTIERVEIINTAPRERLRDLSVVVAGNDKKYDQTCGHFKGPAGDAPVIHLKCPKNTCGRYVKLQVATSPKTYLHVCEVEVYGY